MPHISQILARTRADTNHQLSRTLATHIKQFKESAAPHYLQNFAALNRCLWIKTDLMKTDIKEQTYNSIVSVIIRARV